MHGIYRWLSLLLLLNCSTLVLSCSSTPTCKTSKDCLVGQYCEAKSQRCLPGCDNERGCGGGFNCDVASHQCQPIKCPNNASPIEGKCPCNAQADCPHATFCDKTGARGLCQPICRPGGSSPRTGSCSCPPLWEWAQGRCRKKCPSEWERDKEGLCHLDLASVAPTYWEKDQQGKLRFKCPSGFFRDAKGVCQIDHRSLPEPPKEPIVQEPKLKTLALPPKVPDFQGGPNKPCGQGKWDEDYLQRNSLPNNTKITYIDANAIGGGDGSKSKPYKALSDAIKGASKNTATVLLLAPGSYEWGTVIQREVHIVGRCTDGVKLEAKADTKGHAFEFRYPDITVEGVTIDGGSHPSAKGIFVVVGKGTFVMRHVHVRKTQKDGVRIEGGGFRISHSKITQAQLDGISGGRITENVQIHDSSITNNNGSGILIDGGVDLSIQRNTIEENGTKDNQYGINVFKSTGKITVQNNHVSKNADHGIAAADVKDVWVNNNQVTENGSKSNTKFLSSGIYIFSPTGAVEVQGNHVSSNADCGVTLVRAKSPQVKNNWIHGNKASGIPRAGLLLALHSGTAVVTENHILSHPHVGMYVDQGSGSLDFRGNLVADNGSPAKPSGAGITMANHTGTLVMTENQIKNNHPAGANITGFRTVSIRKNILTENGKVSSEAMNAIGLVVDATQESITFQNNVVEKNYNSMVHLQRTKNVTVQENIFRETIFGKKSSSAALVITDISNKVSVETNHFLQSPMWGMVSQRVANLELKNNLWKQNGGLDSATGSGGLLANGIQQLTITKDSYLENGGNPVTVFETDRFSFTENLLKNNSSHTKTKYGVFYRNDSKTRERAVLQANQIVNQAGYGIVVIKVEDTSIERNRIYNESSFSLKQERAVYTALVTNQVRLHHNFLADGESGFRFENSNIVEISSNQIQNHSDVGLSGLKITDTIIKNNIIQHSNDGAHLGALHSTKHSLRLIGNLIQANKTNGVVLGTHTTTTVEGNAFLSNGTPVPAAKTVNTIGGLRMATNGVIAVRHNLFLDNAHQGISLANGSQVIPVPAQNKVVFEENVIQGSDKAESGSYSITIKFDLRHIDFRRNLIRDNYQGMIIERLGFSGSIAFSENSWIRNKNMGLLISSSRGEIKIQDENFSENGGTQLVLLNSQKRVFITRCGFALGQPSKGLAPDNIAWSGREHFQSSGIGLWAGALGLVRWVFAKDADYPCSPVAKKQVKAVQGYTLRPVRVPFAFDPCLKRRYNLQYRTDEQRQKASLCQTCFARTDGKTGCRWLWEEAGIGQSKGQGIWTPTQKVECVSPDEVATCSQAPEAENNQLRTIKQAVILSGQCVKIPQGQTDPCQLDENKDCEKKQGSQAPWFCGRYNLDGKLTAGCFSNEFPDKSCRGNPCPEGYVCSMFESTTLEKDATPPALDIKDNVFWANGGPDVQLDMAGKVVLQDNIYLFCSPSNPQCKTKSSYQREGTTGWKKVELPQSATIIWQKPSPYGESLVSSMGGNDLLLQANGLPLLFRPELCDAFSTQ